MYIRTPEMEFRACNASRFDRYLIRQGTAFVTVNESNLKQAQKGNGEEEFARVGKIAEKVLSSF